MSQLDRYNRESRRGRRTLRAVALATAAVAVIGGATAAVAQVRGTIVGPGVRQYPVAVSELKSLSPGTGRSDLAAMFADVVARDLELSGLFRVLPRSSHIEAPDRSGITADTINFNDWSVIGALALVKGGFTVDGDRVRLEARLFDVFQRRLLIGRNYHGSVNNMRRMAHRFADEIMAQLTGERGPFDSRIAFVSNRGGRFKELYVMSLDGGDVRQVTFNQTINLAPSWGPKHSLLFTSYHRGNPDLYRLESTGAVTRLASARGLNIGGEYSPDGSRIALSTEERGNPDIVLIDPSGQTTGRVTDSFAIDVSPTWSPDGRSLAFCSNRAGGPQIYVAGVGGEAQPRRVSFQGDYNTSPVWSPKGDRIAYVSRVGGGRFDIFTVKPDGSDRVQVTSGPGSNEDPSWSPDGRYLVFSSNRTGQKKLFIVRADGGNAVQLTSGNGDDTSPAWSRWLD
jgi:TolB protein